MAQADALMRRFGANSCAFAALGPGFCWWRHDAAAGVAYVDTGTAWVAAGPPLAAPARLEEVARAFVRAARCARRRATFFAAPAQLLGPGRALLVGEEPWWRPGDWPATLRRRASLRQQLQRARHKGVQVRALSSEHLACSTHPDRLGAEALLRRWLSGHAMPPMGFLVAPQPFDRAAERHYWLAEVLEPVAGVLQPVAFAATAPIYAAPFGGAAARGAASNLRPVAWVLAHLIRAPDAPNGAAELLVDAAMHAAHAQGAGWITLGMVPLRRVRSRVLHIIRRLAAGLYHFDGLARFKHKLAPSRWLPVYLVSDAHPVMATYDVLRAFVPGNLWAFAWGIVVRDRP